MFDKYINQHGKRLFYLCLKLCRTRENAEDLYQETWLAAYRSFEKYDRAKEFEGWLTTICVNRYRDMLRKTKWRFIFPEFGTNEEKDLAMANVPVQQNDDDYSDVRDAVDALPEKYKLAVTLYYFDGFDVKKVSDTLKLPEGTVKYRLHIAREMLRKELGEIGE